ncbi:unnamed protein product [Acanthoscelides obtectus]|uniref:Nuclear hormone receptor HR96 n=1 Tax=Acanthoscelides obtectus TaxID=200917 RepID=A0A9P0M4S5_ACAOB|nr:unnamed protein product [Acanthoscelides obtectus]CAK1626505.1 Nuclear hormone receptor HR96 [Acanthoscelides obtectus]
MKSKSDSKVCLVCGDKALGYNFNAITCESCKAFFRRNALVEKEFKCPFNNNCDITTVTRRFCQKCRLDKCFTVGMCKDLIMSEQDKVAKRQKIQENRARKRNYRGFKGFKKVKKELMIEPDSQSTDFSNHFYSSNDSSDTNISDQGYTPNNSDLLNTMYSNSRDHLLSGEKVVSSSDDISMLRNILNPTNPNQKGMHEDTSCLNAGLGNNNDTSCNNNVFNIGSSGVVQDSRLTIDSITKDVVNDVQRVQSLEPSPIESILCEAIKLEFEAFSSIAQYNSTSRELNDAERAKLNELIVANKALLVPIDDELDSLNRTRVLQSKPQQKTEESTTIVDLINLTALAIRRLIKMVKKINSFKNMCQEDQVALLKGGCTEIMLLRSAMNYDPQKRTWEIPHTQELNVDVDILKLAKGNIYQEHEKFIKTFDPKWIADENIILILSAVVLFTPDRPRVVHQDVIKLEQNSYYYLLRRYLESVYPGCEAKSTFLKLIQKITELHKVNEELINVYLDVNPSQVEPLLIEIFDLKSKQ